MKDTYNIVLFESDEPVTLVTAGNFGPGGLKLRSIIVEQGILGKLVRIVPKGGRKERSFSLNTSKGIQVLNGHPRLLSIQDSLEFLGGESKDLSPMDMVRSITNDHTVLFEWTPMESF